MKKVHVIAGELSNDEIDKLTHTARRLADDFQVELSYSRNGEAEFTTIVDAYEQRAA